TPGEQVGARRSRSSARLRAATHLIARSSSSARPRARARAARTFVAPVAIYTAHSERPGVLSRSARPISGDESLRARLAPRRRALLAAWCAGRLQPAG